jgi:hypothetical protein
MGSGQGKEEVGSCAQLSSSALPILFGTKTAAGGLNDHSIVDR